MRYGRQCRKIQNGEVVDHHSRVIGARSGVIRRFKPIAVVFVKVQMRCLAGLCKEGVVAFLHLVIDGTLNIRKDILDGTFQHFIRFFAGIL